PPARPLHAELSRALDDTERLTRGSPDSLAALNVGTHRQEINALLVRASELARAGAGPPQANLAGARLTRQSPPGPHPRGARLRGTHLTGADLTGADLRMADLTGADLRGADLSGADLSTSIFLAQSQLDAAKGDQATRLPASRTRPAHWPATPRPLPR